jgi:hypothetical protein
VKIRTFLTHLLGVMFSISRSRFTLLTQFAFLAINAAGVLCSTIYNANTPDLYPNNAHHKIGWLLTWICCAQVVIGVISAYAGHRDNKQKDSGYTPVSREAMAEHTRRLQRNDSRLSNDSGQGTEPNTESLRSGSISVDEDEEITLGEPDKDESEVEKIALMKGTKIDKYLARRLPGLISARILRVFEFAYNVVDRLILLLGFVAFTTGIITYGGLFVSLTIKTPSHHLTNPHPERRQSFQRSCPLHQRFRILLVRHPHTWSLGRLFCRARMVVEHQANRKPPLHTQRRICRKFSHFLLRCYECVFGAFGGLGE